MGKDAYYFPHFCNARHDRKIKRVIKELGIEGYGIFFMLLEVLREQTDFKYPMDDIDLLADEFGTSEPKVRTVICNYKLFNIDEKQKFFSPKLLMYLQPYFKASEHARLAANKRWKKDGCSSNARALPEQCESNASKVNKSKVNKSIYTTEFNTFYSEYPRAEEKGRTFSNWKKWLKTHSVDDLMKAMKNYKTKVTAKQTEKDYIKTSANFLGKDGYFKEYIDYQPETSENAKSSNRYMYGGPS